MSPARGGGGGGVREVLEWPYAIRGGGGYPSPKTKVTIVGENVGKSGWAIFGIQIFGPQTPPPFVILPRGWGGGVSHCVSSPPTRLVQAPAASLRFVMNGLCKFPPQQYPPPLSHTERYKGIPAQPSPAPPPSREGPLGPG